MTSSASLAAALARMPSLPELFRLFLSGKHLNRLAEPALWAELEQHEADYVHLFAALGFELRLDARGFAWFHSAEASNHIGRISRQLALLFMVIFDAQANAGQALQRFTDWRIDRAWLEEACQPQQDMLAAEGLEPDTLTELLGRACSLGLAMAETGGWRLLPAVYRYLDHFEDLAANSTEGDDGAPDEMDPASPLGSPADADEHDAADEPDADDPPHTPVVPARPSRSSDEEPF